MTGGHDDAPPRPGGFEDFPIGEQMTLWAVRLWVRALRGSPTLHGHLRSAFVVADIPDGYLALDGMMTTLAAGATREFEIGCACCDVVTDDEQALLGIVSEFQCGTAATAHLVLETWLPPAAVRIAAEHFSQYSLILKATNLLVRARDWNPAVLARASGLHRIH